MAGGQPATVSAWIARTREPAQDALKGPSVPLFSYLLLSAALTLGQTGTEPPPAATPPPNPTPSPFSDRWLLMKSLQGTWPGWLLDENRTQITGWTDVSFTASTDRRDQLPMGFNFR